ncbi:MAG TPA: TetR/AcrR family transcriptional regulator [Baekduia sp.]|jgi:AcrR family transcriptional regulator
MPTITDLPPGKVSEARSRLLETASGLFYREGVNTIGVDRIVSEASVTRATFYRHFPSKEHLVLAYLQAAHDSIAERMSGPVAIDDPRERLRAIGDDIVAQIKSPGFQGCAFIKVASEFDDPDSAVRRAVAAHRKWFAKVVRTAFADAGNPNTANPARHFVMLRDGAMVDAYLDGPKQAADTFARGVDGLLRLGTGPDAGKPRA